MEELSKNELILIAFVGALWLAAYAIKRRSRTLTEKDVELLAEKVAEKLK